MVGQTHNDLTSPAVNQLLTKRETAGIKGQDMTETKINSNSDLLGFLVMKMASDKKDWFGFPEQRVTGINLVHEIAKRHADKMSPQDVVLYVKELNDAIYQGFIKVR